MDRALAIGIPKEDLWIDCLTLTVSAQQEQAMETLKAVRRVTEELGLNTVLGVSNISFGLPNRMLVTQAFLMSAFEAGLKLPIINPNQKEIMDMVAARRVLSGEDESCRAYVDRFAETAPAEVKAPAAAGKELTLQDAIRRGMKKEAARITAEALKAGSGMEIVEQELIPALEKTGEAYEKGTVFLPQLLSAAQAAQAAFEQIKEAVLKQGGKTQDRGTLIMATVQGDIHDIGKNIVVTVLENYGWRVIDLGRDVPPETIVRETVEKNIRLVGLSALMTTTLPAMEETVRQLKALDNPPRVMVGGAVVTADYAARIGADDYAKDVRDSVKIAMDAFGDKPAG
jgi:5-methyltetrahydrofolate--homocysteine methyltransferase